jgi:SAM-dependent methyltransferase
MRPVSRRCGFDRGTPIDRFYLDTFFGAYTREMSGRVLEARYPTFSSLFGGDIAKLDLIDIDARNDQATIIADLSDPESLPTAAFDCVVLPHVLHLVSDLEAAISNVWQSIAPGGTLLLSTPAIAKCDHELAHIDRWRVLPLGLSHLLRRRCPHGDVHVHAYGNLLTSVALLYGIAAEELALPELRDADPEFPTLACGRARKPS